MPSYYVYNTLELQELHCASEKKRRLRRWVWLPSLRACVRTFRCARWGMTSVNPRCQCSLQHIIACGSLFNWSASAVGVASLSALGGKNLWAESVWGTVGVRCPDLGDKMRPLLGGSVMGGSTLVGSPQKRQHSSYIPGLQPHRPNLQ